MLNESTPSGIVQVVGDVGAVEDTVGLQIAVPSFVAPPSCGSSVATVNEITWSPPVDVSLLGSAKVGGVKVLV